MSSPRTGVAACGRSRPGRITNVDVSARRPQRRAQPPRCDALQPVQQTTGARPLSDRFATARAHPAIVDAHIGKPTLRCIGLGKAHQPTPGLIVFAGKVAQPRPAATVKVSAVLTQVMMAGLVGVPHDDHAHVLLMQLGPRHVHQPRALCGLFGAGARQRRIVFGISRRLGQPARHAVERQRI